MITLFDPKIDELQNAAVEAGTTIIMWLKLNAPLESYMGQWLKDNPTDEIQVVKIGPARDLRIKGSSEEPQRVAQVGDFEQPIHLAVMPAGAILSGAAAGARVVYANAGAIVRWLSHFAKLGVAYVVGETALNLTSPTTGPGATLRIAFPLVLVALILYLWSRR